MPPPMVNPQASWSPLPAWGEARPHPHNTPQVPNMPRAPRYCPRCPTLVTAGQAYCDQCQPVGWATHPSQRNTQHTREETRAFRRAVLAREPNCRHCGNPATQADHIVPVADGGTNDPATNGQGLCDECHATKTKHEHRQRRK